MMNLQIGDLVMIPPDRPGPKVGRIKNIDYNPIFPEESKCVIEREYSFILGIRLGDLKKIEVEKIA